MGAQHKISFSRYYGVELWFIEAILKKGTAAMRKMSSHHESIILSPQTIMSLLMGLIKTV